MKERKWGVWLGHNGQPLDQEFSSQEEAESFVDRLVAEDLDHQNVWLKTAKTYVRFSSVDVLRVDEFAT